jgi:hypothetical protein
LVKSGFGETLEAGIDVPEVAVDVRELLATGDPAVDFTD